MQDLNNQSNQGNTSLIQCQTCANLEKCEVKNCDVIKLSKCSMFAHYCSKVHFYHKIIAKEELTNLEKCKIKNTFECPRKDCTDPGKDAFKKKYDLVRHLGVRHGLIQYFLQKETKGNEPEPQPGTSNSIASTKDTSNDDENKLDNTRVISVFSSETEDHEMSEEEIVSFA